jgi:argininosuccinate lyase
MALWGGRFTEQMDKLMAKFSSSLDVDSRLWEADIRASVAHVKMLAAQKIISASDAEKIVGGLNEINAEIREGTWMFNPAAEDVHGEIESRLIEKIGEPAKKMHTARSRNDQVATDTRLYLSEKTGDLVELIRGLQKTMIEIAERHTSTVMPGMTHTQHAQPVSLAHHMMAYFWMLQRDAERFSGALPRILTMPLGSAALAGTGFPIDRAFTAKELGFSSVSENSMDSVGDRDFVLEFLSDASICMMHLSRLCEELILWSTPEFGFVELSEKVTTGSSIMPQKKNPDAAELIRGRCGRVYGALVGALTVMKALPLSYNRDQQEDKVHLFSALDTLEPSLALMDLMLKSAEWRVERMANSLSGDFSNATDLADDLVGKGLSFREAHEVVGAVVRACIKDGVKLEALSAADLQVHHRQFDSNSVARLKHDTVMSARKSEGGTAPEQVRRQIIRAKNLLK